VIYESRDGKGPETAARAAIMTLRAKKSDVDEFAKGKTDLEQFRKKVSISTYPANTGSGAGIGF
jgi:hypothetical protein